VVLGEGDKSRFLLTVASSSVTLSPYSLRDRFRGRARLRLRPFPRGASFLFLSLIRVGQNCIRDLV
jgi:hypothetical protein